MMSDEEHADPDSRQNPYAPPATENARHASGEVSDESARALRRAHLGREKAIKRVAWINLVCAIIWVLPTVGSLIVLLLMALRAMSADIAPSLNLPPPAPYGGVFGLITLVNASLLSLWVALFLGLRSLQSWARWTMVAVAVLVLYGVCFNAYVRFAGLAKPSRGDAPAMLLMGGVFAIVLHVLISPPSGRVFTRQYREAVAKTRGMRL
jgi:hypothetical protein